MLNLMLAMFGTANRSPEDMINNEDTVMKKGWGRRIAIRLSALTVSVSSDACTSTRQDVRS